MQLVKFTKTAREKYLTMNEINYTIKKSVKGESSLQISKDSSRDHGTIKKMFQGGAHPRKKKFQAEFRNLTTRDLSHIRREVIRNPNASSAFMFQTAGVPMMSRETRCKVLRKFADVKNPTKKPILTVKHKEKKSAVGKKY